MLSRMHSEHPLEWNHVGNAQFFCKDEFPFRWVQFFFKEKGWKLEHVIFFHIKEFPFYWIPFLRMFTVFIIIQINLPSNCPGNIPVTLKSPVLSSRIFLVNPLVLVSSPGPNMANFGVFLGKNERNKLDKLWKLWLSCLIRVLISGEHFK